MRTLKIAAAVTPFLFAAAPVTGQQKPAAPAPAPRARPAPAARPAPKPAPPAAVATPRIQLEVTGALGYTIVDMNKWSASTASDWNTMNYGGAARVLLPLRAGLRLGLEAGYRFQFWYTVPVAGFSYVRQYDVTATHLAALVRLPLAPRITADVGAGMHFFNRAGTYAGALGAITYGIPAGKLVIPIGVRADFIFTDPMVLPVVLDAGVRLSL